MFFFLAKLKHLLFHHSHFGSSVFLPAFIGIVVRNGSL